MFSDCAEWRFLMFVKFLANKLLFTKFYESFLKDESFFFFFKIYLFKKLYEIYMK